MVSKKMWIALEEALNKQHQLAKLKIQKNEEQIGEEKDGSIDFASRYAGSRDH